MQRIFKYGDIQNISLTSDKELNILIYRTTSYVIIYRTYALLNLVHFLAHPVVHYFNEQKFTNLWPDFSEYEL